MDAQPSELREKTTSGLDCIAETHPNEDEVVGKTPDGTGEDSFDASITLVGTKFMALVSVFRVPTTHDVLTLFSPYYPKSDFDILNLALLGLQLLLFFHFPRHLAKRFFFVYFLFWRAAYDGGLGWILTKQSKRKWIVREIQRLGWLDEHQQPTIRAWIRAQLAGKMGRDYSFNVRLVSYRAVSLSHYEAP